MEQVEGPRKLRVGAVIHESAGLLRREAAVFFGIAAFIFAPVAAADYLTPDLSMTLGPGPEQLVRDNLPAVLVWLLAFGAQLVAQATLIHGVFRARAGERADFGASVRVALSRLPAVLVLAAITAIARGTGLAFCILPGILILIATYVALPALIVEQLSPLKALSRGVELARKRYPEIFGLLLLTFGLQWGLQRAARLMSGALEAVAGELPVAFLLDCVVELVMLTFGAVVSTVTYLHLRSVDEQASEPDLLAVFD